MGEVYLNSYYPTYGSMFSVYLGLHDKTSIDNTGTYAPPTVKVDIAEQFIVNIFLNTVKSLALVDLLN